jgi:hypothetical protein
MVGRIKALCLALGALIAVGCGGGKLPETNSMSIIEPPALQAGTWSNGNAITLSLSKEGKFQAVFKGKGSRSVVKGKATLKDGKIVLEASEFDGKPAQKANERTPSAFTYSADWSNLTSEEGVVLTRKI